MSITFNSGSLRRRKDRQQRPRAKSNNFTYIIDKQKQAGKFHFGLPEWKATNIGKVEDPAELKLQLGEYLAQLAARIDVKSSEIMFKFLQIGDLWADETPISRWQTLTPAQGQHKLQKFIYDDGNELIFCILMPSAPEKGSYGLKQFGM